MLLSIMLQSSPRSLNFSQISKYNVFCYTINKNKNNNNKKKKNNNNSNNVTFYCVNRKNVSIKCDDFLPRCLRRMQR